MIWFIRSEPLYLITINKKYIKIMAIGSRKLLTNLSDFSDLERFGLTAGLGHDAANEFKRLGEKAMTNRMYVIALQNYSAALFVEAGCKHVRFGFISTVLRLHDQAFKSCVIGSMSPAALPAVGESIAYFKGKESAGYGPDVSNPYVLSPARGDWRRGFQAGRREVEDAIKNNQSEAYPYKDQHAEDVAAALKRPSSRAKSQYVKDRLRAIELSEA